MVRSVAKKVMWVGRATAFLLGLAVILALVFGAASTALGANGDFFKLGRKNVASAVSTLVKQGNGPALSLEVRANQPPLKVDSSKKVAMLNADLVDGKNSTEFISGYQIVEAATALDSTDTKFKYADCPPGMEVVGGGASAFGEYGKVVVARSEPAAPPTSWYGQAFEIGQGTTGNWLLEVTAICADAQ